MTATPPIVDRETWQYEIDTQRVAGKAHTREGTRLPRLAGDCRWSRSTRHRRWTAPPAGSRSSTPSRSQSQQLRWGPWAGRLPGHAASKTCREDQVVCRVCEATHRGSIDRSVTVGLIEIGRGSSRALVPLLAGWHIA